MPVGAVPFSGASPTGWMPGIHHPPPLAGPGPALFKMDTFMLDQPVAQKNMNQITRARTHNRKKSGNEGNNDLVLAAEVCCYIIRT